MTNEPSYLVGREILAVMARKGVKQNALALQLFAGQDMKRETATKWLSRRLHGEVSPTLEDLLRIASALECDLGEFLTGVGISQRIPAESDISESRVLVTL